MKKEKVYVAKRKVSEPKVAKVEKVAKPKVVATAPIVEPDVIADSENSSITTAALETVDTTPRSPETVTPVEVKADAPNPRPRPSPKRPRASLTARSSFPPLA